MSEHDIDFVIAANNMEASRRAMKPPIEVGMVIAADYPFVRESITLDDEDGSQVRESWRPGCVHEFEENRRSSWAHGVGLMILFVVSKFKPGKYPERVFYTRQWRDPDGKTFGKAKLRITTTTNFRSLCAGYRHDYGCDP